MMAPRLVAPKLVAKEGVEPTRPCDRRFLRPLRLPFRHFAVRDEGEKDGAEEEARTPDLLLGKEAFYH